MNRFKLKPLLLKIAYRFLRLLFALLSPQRQELFDAEDEADPESKRDEMIAALEKPMHQQSTPQRLFKIRRQIA